MNRTSILPMAKPFHAGRGCRFALTLVELLVVIAIVGLLAMLILLTVQASREAAHRTSCSNNMRQIGLGIRQYEAANQYFPNKVIPIYFCPTHR